MSCRTKRERKEVADKNAEIYKALTPEQKIARLDERLGKSIGAVKERRRLSQCHT